MSEGLARHKVLLETAHQEIHDSPDIAFSGCGCEMTWREFGMLWQDNWFKMRARMMWWRRLFWVTLAVLVVVAVFKVEVRF